jgi:site-specific recombinase XerC
MLTTLRTFYRWAVEQEYVALSPAATFKTPKKPHPQPRALTMEQVRTLVDYLRAQQGRRERRDEALLLTALYAGLRANELAKLCWPNVDITAGIVNIELSKMGHGRSVTIHPALAGLLLRWREVQELSKDAPVFSLDGLAFTSNRVGKIAARTRKATGLPMTAHVLRHTFATWTLRRSRDLYSVSKALGHRQLAQTEIYISTDVEGIRPALDKLPGLEGW